MKGNEKLDTTELSRAWLDTTPDAISMQVCVTV
jgi:hypothetical protein